MLSSSIIATSLAVAFSLLGDSALYAVLPSQAENIGLRLSLVGIILSANRFVRLLTNISSGYIYDYLLRPWLFIVALVVGAITTSIYGLFWQFWILLIARLVWGACWSFIRLEGYSIVAKTTMEQQYGKSMGYYKSISGLGFLAGYLLGGVFVDSFGYRNCFLTLACITISGVIIIFCTSLYQRPKERSKTHDSHSRKNAEESNVSDNLKLKENIRNQVAISYVAFINALVSSGIVVSTLGLLLKTRFGTSIDIWRISIGVASLTGFLLSIRSFMNLILAPVFGHLSDRVGRSTLIFSGLLSGGVSLISLAFFKRPFFLVPAIFGNYASTIAISVSSDASIAKLTPQALRGRFISGYVTWLDFGAALGPIFGYLIGASFSLEWMYLAGLLFFISAIFVYARNLTKDKIGS